MVRSAPTRDSAVSVTRHLAHGSHAQPYAARMSAEPAFVLLYQLRDHPPHDFTVSGRYQQTPLLKASTFHFVDLRDDDAHAVLRHPADTLIMHFPTAALHDIVEDGLHLEHLAEPMPWASRDPVLAQMMPLLVDALGRPTLHEPLLVDHVMLGIGAHVSTRYGRGRARAAPSRGALAPWQRRRALELLDAGGGQSLQQIAEACGLSAHHFARAFKAATGSTPHAWQQQRRVAQARSLLRAGALSLAEIAEACGFA